MIDLEILLKNGGDIKKYSKQELIFKESEHAKYYFQIIEGSVRMYNSNPEGKEFTQGYFGNSESFGEPPLIIDEPYPANAQAMVDSSIIRINKINFIDLLKGRQDITLKFLSVLSLRIYKKSITSRDLINHNPEQRILSLLENYKYSQNSNGYKVLIPYTRQEIANFTGLRVETVIRTISKLNKRGILTIENKKVMF